MKKIINPVLPLLFVIILLSACKKFVDVGQPKNQLVTDQVFADSANATAAIRGIYVNMMQSFSLNIASGGMTLYPGLSADELTMATVNATNNEFLINHISNVNTANAYLWTSAYKYIYSANAAVEGVTASTGISATGKNQLTAEAKFLRSFVYFYLVNLYGDVPLVTTTAYAVNGVLPRSPKAGVYQLMESDLQFAEANLTNDGSANDRATSLAASGLLAKVYLYESKYELAAQEATKVIGSGTFQLETDLSNVFTAWSTETVMKFDPVYPGKQTWEGYTFVPSSAKVIPKYTITSFLSAAFEAGDLRKDKWITVNTVSGKTYPYPSKYKNPGTLATPQEDYVVIRLAELYLIRAEALANAGNLTEALGDVNLIRKRAGLPAFAGSDKTSLFNAILHERQCELFCEWGNRWLDLKRLGLVDKVLSAEKTGWTSQAALYPIPLTEITNNPKLVQNPGY
ncbi:RagB/SusD family nutrient uptake outer membrane protein [Mucilaginibacter sp. Bleaf8]|uniref:RagB/SusD family nutrient uptake outer membrane protein n=1 Tax=Mucilaginibacter sp. Bleaf8 TaxID=2834430 RepID=UPI001BD1A6B8|nr:RagB/SusD family nutrient uptake outer membrane protein [Mucilaginibacter sp. Bleaf8]MBS7565541.1 RagB/SusD family nutrient uptake outer membrane protein [Mucilaginibacter sp. Bleaf8]